MALTLTFTYPPQVNNMFTVARGRKIKSAAYRSWMDLNAALSKRQRFSAIAGPYRMTMLATAPDKRRRDLDNIIKPVGDLLQTIGAVADDCNMRELRAAWVEGAGAGITVTLEPMS